MSSQKGNTAQKVFEIVAPIAKQQGLEIWDIRYLKEGASYFLRIFIEKEEGITIEDCENFSRAIDEPLDAADPIKESYYLEVSSPGLQRELTKDEHFKRFIGEEVIVKLFRPIEKRKEFIGILKNYENGKVVIECSDKVFEFNKTDISKVNLNDLDF